MEEPNISVLISCFNASIYLRVAIESILSQTYKNFELILIDDGSTDNTLEIIRHYAALDNRIKVIQKENTGLADSLNVGLKYAIGEWIARMDTDDVSLPDRLKKQLNFVQKNNRVKLLGAGCIEINEAGQEIKKHYYPSSHDQLVKQMEKGGSPFPHSTAFFYKKAVFKFGSYRNRLNGAEDVDLWLRMSSGVQLGCLYEPLIKLRKHKDSITGSRDADKYRNVAVISTVARVSHHLRKKGHPDPVAAKADIEWARFLAWVEKRIGEEGVIEQKLTWQAARDIYFRHEHRLIGGLHFAGYLLSSGHAGVLIKEKFLGSDLPERLVREWIESDSDQQ